MASQAKEEDAQPAPDSQQMNSSSSTGWTSAVVGFYSRTKEHAETYPYVWGSYISVYGGLGLWLAYRFRKLRKAEDRVRVLQRELQKSIAAEIAAERSKAGSSAATSKAVSSAATSKAKSLDATPKPMK